MIDLAGGEKRRRRSIEESLAVAEILFFRQAAFRGEPFVRGQQVRPCISKVTGRARAGGQLLRLK